MTDRTDLSLTRTHRRVPGLDVVRGVAILGTLASNIWLFVAFSGTPVVDDWWRGFLRDVTDGKFLGLLTIMFGIGVEIQRQAAVRHGRRWPGAYCVRLVLLFLDGMLNYIFLVQFDVLRAYAVVGFVVAFILLLKERWQWVFIVVALVAHLTQIVVFGVFPTLYERMPTFVLPGEPLVYDGPPTYWQTVQEASRTVVSDFTLGTDTGSIVTLGMVAFAGGALLYRKGIFDERGARLRRWLMVVGLGVGLPVDLTLAVAGQASVYGRFILAPLVAFGVLAAMAEFYREHRVGFAGRRLAAVGRMALSCYVLQNLIGRLSQELISGSSLSGALDPVVGTLLMFLVVSTLLVLFAELWLRLFRRGPLELVWDVAFRLVTRQEGARPARA